MNKLNVNNLEEIIRACLPTDEEITPEIESALKRGEIVPGFKTQRGIMKTFCFNAKRLEENTPKIAEMLAELPEEFMQDTGGGWSFLNACVNKDGEQWTGFHDRMDDLFILGMACGKAKLLTEDRQLWKSLPGGMPYFVVLK